MQALILAAGEGKRIKPIITSKPLIPFGGQTLLDRAISNLKTMGINKFLVVVSPKDKDKLKSYPIVVQPEPNGMAGAVLATRSVLVGPTVVVNGDDLIDPKIIQQFYKQINKTPDQIVLTGFKSKKSLSGGYFDGLKIVEKPVKRPSNWLKLVLDYFPKIEKFISVLESTKFDKDDVYEQALNRLNNLSLVKAAGYFQPLKYPWQILEMTQIFLTKCIKPDIDKTAKIFPGSYIINSYVGPNVVIGHNVLVRDSIVESDTVVGYGEIIPGRIKLGAIMARGSQLGVNASVMPGVSLGAKAIVGSGLVLAKSLEAGEFKKN
ncbi:MAG: Nucleotidyltransferase family protein [Candidatus Beckwithbacteria bacterium GW2011_GWA2_43_10]|uniref:Nucleotidyltransferase family protein n=1 Tax=Candidatus Beckwithbacteria bacterium GW2011_GWA2_43_10 TaxID=1618369 RepID=A0A0G1EZW2_9BACT|nr:MAG: Nucleotidyltransferase family protein [Candidatus Beckwithbacteria bacterium GW2011_GWA2_43_10]